MKCPNPFRDDPLWEWLVSKWGQPNNLGAEPNGGFRYVCDRCLAEWVGPNGDTCYWCHKRWQAKEESRKLGLLYPEWLTWDDAYFGLGKLGQSVWEETRGFRGDFIRPWLQRIKKAKANAEITESEFVAAGRRYTRWINRMP